MPSRTPAVPPGPDAPPTIADVAREADVSKTTASDALRGHGRVSEPTRRAVLAAAERLGYAPNRSARSLRTSVTETIALHIPEFLTGAEYYMAFVFGVAEQAARAGLNVTLLSSGHLPHRRGAVPQVDGIVLCDPVAEDPVVEQLMNSGLPVVTAERYVGRRQPTGVIWSDHDTAMTALLDHLYEAGARCPAFVAPDITSDWSLTLQRTHARWCGERGLPVLVSRAPFGPPPDVLRGVVRELLARTPGIDAIVCAADGAAAVVLPELRAGGRTVGEDLLLASCVDSSAMRTAEPPITAVDLRPRTMGVECARLLCEILAGETPRGTVRVLPIEMHMRASTRA
ncbi:MULTISPECIES: LacI family DNA-binding transcriptional regulator [Streptomyces]|uniref:LacI family DNA-binding transcriptional regulator n=1 Tax=Streptomyces griseiscabiei TaxID=2993540 RepID=A0ABU4L657_9ACTN|nr:MULTISPECIES: LacI family DNA-binding transcriptional regulator [Streptomyces]MBZ3901698.1 LacI family DNA-binding transcriptional regulator [Streptomyces griseiscabiei]MDX2911103.1 LacI family DNA-binding transcriptional regulator [Streptomyces griseiscabiei]